MERTGGSLTHKASECVRKMAGERPPRLRRFDASRYFLDGAATPPHEEGNNPLIQFGCGVAALSLMQHLRSLGRSGNMEMPLSSPDHVFVDEGYPPINILLKFPGHLDA